MSYRVHYEKNFLKEDWACLNKLLSFEEAYAQIETFDAQHKRAYLIDASKVLGAVNTITANKTYDEMS